MRVLEDFEDSINRHARDLGFYAETECFVAIERCRPMRDRGIDGRAICVSFWEGAPLALARHFRCAYQGRQSLKDLIVSTRDGNPAAVLCRIMAVRQGVLHGGPHTLADKAIEMVGGGKLVEEPEDRLVEADVDILAFAGEFSAPNGQKGAESDILL